MQCIRPILLASYRPSYSCHAKSGTAETRQRGLPLDASAPAFAVALALKCSKPEKSIIRESSKWCGSLGNHMQIRSSRDCGNGKKKWPLPAHVLLPLGLPAHRGSLETRWQVFVHGKHGRNNSINGRNAKPQLNV